MINPNLFMKTQGITNMMVPRGKVVQMMDTYSNQYAQDLKRKLKEAKDEITVLKSKNRALKKSFEHKKQVMKNIMQITKFEI